MDSEGPTEWFQITRLGPWSESPELRLGMPREVFVGASGQHPMLHVTLSWRSLHHWRLMFVNHFGGCSPVELQAGYFCAPQKCCGYWCFGCTPVKAQAILGHETETRLRPARRVLFLGAFRTEVVLREPSTSAQFICCLFIVAFWLSHLCFAPDS